MTTFIFYYYKEPEYFSVAEVTRELSYPPPPPGLVMDASRREALGFGWCLMVMKYLLL